MKPCRNYAFIDEHGGSPKAPGTNYRKTSDGGGITQMIYLGYSFGQQLSIPQDMSLVPILVGHVPGIPSTVENKSESTLIHLWEMVDNG